MMKKLLKFGTMLAVVLSAMATYAGESDFALFAKKGDGKTVRVSFNTITKMDLSIYDDNNALVFEENLTGATGIKRTYNLDELPEGTYFLEAKTEVKIARYEMNVGNNSVVISQKPVSETYKPVVKNNAGMVSFNIPKGSKSKVGVKIYDADSNELYNETLSAAELADKKFDISQAADGKYTFVMTYNNQMFAQTLASR